MKSKQRRLSKDGLFFSKKTIQFVLTPEESKKLIAFALASHPKIKDVLNTGKMLFKGGSTVGYLSELISDVPVSICGYIDESGTRMNMAMDTPHLFMYKQGKITDLDDDRVLFDQAQLLSPNDIVFCGGNALDSEGNVAMLLGSEEGGGIPALLELWHNNNVPILVPIGYEKLIPGKIPELIKKVSREKADLSFGMGVGLAKIPGKAFTELDAIQTLAKVDAYVVSSGGLGSAQGSLLLEIDGSEEEASKLLGVIKMIKKQKDLDLLKKLVRCIPGCKYCEEHRACIYLKEK